MPSRDAPAPRTARAAALCANVMTAPITAAALCALAGPGRAHSQQPSGGEVRGIIAGSDDAPLSDN